MRMNNGTMPFMFNTPCLAVSLFGDLIDLMESFQASGRESLLFHLGLLPTSSKLATVSEALDVAPIKILDN